MGLSISHDSYDGGYCTFNLLREEIAIACNIPLIFMEGFCLTSDMNRGGIAPLRLSERLQNGDNYWSDRIERFLPIKWEHFKQDPICIFLDHSDCSGTISPADGALIADRLEGILDKLQTEPKNWREMAEQIIAGFRAAHNAGETITFA